MSVDLIHLLDMLLCFFRRASSSSFFQISYLDLSLSLPTPLLHSSHFKTAACSCRALRDAADDRTAWSSALERALPGVRALLEASPPDWALEERKGTAGELRHPKLLLAALAAGSEFAAQVFNRELDNEAEDFLLSCYDAKLSLERWRPSAGDEDEEGGGEKEEGKEVAAAAGVLTRARAAAAALAAAAAATAAAAPSPSSSSSFGECPRSPRLTRRRRMRPEEEKAVAATAAAAAAAAAVASSSRGPPSPAATAPGRRKRRKKSKRSPAPGLPLRGISPTYTARYLPMGRSLAVETGVGAGRVRAAAAAGAPPPPPPRSHEDGGNGNGGGASPPPAPPPPPPSPLSLSPGDAVEVQWKATESHPYGFWLGCVVSVFSPEGSGVAAASAARETATAATRDGGAASGGGGGGNGNAAAASSSSAATVDVLFQQYGLDSPWQVVYSVPLLPPGSNIDSPVNGDPAFGFVGGVRGPLTAAELGRWEGAWRSAEGAAAVRGRSRPARALSAGLASASPRGAPAAGGGAAPAPAHASAPLVVS